MIKALFTFWLILVMACSQDQTAGTTTETTNGSIVGSVTYNDGGTLRPAADISIRLIPLYKKALAEVFEITSNEEGLFEIPEIPPGQYSLVIKSDVHKYGRKLTVEIKDGEELDIGEFIIDTMSFLKIKLSTFSPTKVTGVEIPELDTIIERSKFPPNSSTTLSIGAIPAGVYHQIFLHLETDFSKGYPLLKESVEALTLDTLVLSDSIVKSIQAPQGFFSHGLDWKFPTDTIEISSLDQFLTQLDKAKELEESKVFKIISSFSGDTLVPIPSNSVVIGANPDIILDGVGMSAIRVERVIIKNLTLINSPVDGVEIRSTKRVWLDHVTIKNTGDELLAISHGSDSITVSWSRFLDQNNAVLIGNSDSNVVEDSTRLHVTMHHNWFYQNKEQNPRIRYGKVHLFNNFFQELEGYGVASTMFAETKLEKNIFDQVPTPVELKFTSPKKGKVEMKENLFFDSGEFTDSEPVFEIPYAYDSWETLSLETVLQNHTGNQ